MKLSKEKIADFNDLFWEARLYYIRTGNLYRINVLVESVMPPAVWAAKDQLNCQMEHLSKYQSYVRHDVHLSAIHAISARSGEKRNMFQMLFDVAVWSYKSHYEESIKVDLVLDA